MHRLATAIAAVVAASAGIATPDAAAQNQNQNQDQPAPPPVGTTDARPIDNAPAPRWAGPADHLETNTIPSHPPIDLIPPMPLPESTDDRAGAGPGLPISHDGITGEISFGDVALPSRAEGGEGPGYTAPFNNLALEPGVASRGFGTMSQITTVGSDPWRRNVKVIMRFQDDNGNDRFFSCSGTMADAETVLTAGHCVYNRDSDIDSFANAFWIYPGWDGNGPTADNGAYIETHGIGYGTFSGTFTGWSQDGNFDWDMGLIRINRAVGQLTGWYGWAWGFGCSTIQSRTYHNPAYPAEGCGTTGLHNGRDMYYWFGSIDSCPGNQMKIDTTAGCFTALWGGMSGSGVYYFNDNDTRLVHGVASNSNRTTSGRYAKMWESFKDYMLDFENDSRGNTTDLQALRARYTASTVDAGQSVGGDDYVITNPTNANPANNTFTVRHYLSTNSNISSFDTLIRTETFTYDFGPMGTTTVNTTGLNYTIPVDTPSGDYFMGVEIDYNDASSSNNSTDEWDAMPITVNAVADIVSDSISSSNSTIFRDDSFPVSFSFTNQGADPSNLVSYEVRLSTNTTISSFDTLLASGNSSGLAGGDSATRNITVNLPASVAEGTYYLGVINTSSDDVDASNNAVASVTTVQVDSRSDLVASATNAANGSYAPGDSLPLGFTVANNGLGASGSYSVEVRASTNTTISSFDTLLDTYNFSSLAAGSDRNTNLSAPIPNTLAEGDYYIGIIVSQGDNETALSNNTDFDSTTINIDAGAACPGDTNADSAVDLNDLLTVLSNFGSPGAGPSDGDVDDSGTIDLNDLLLVLSNFGVNC